MEATIRKQGWLWVSVAALAVLGSCRFSGTKSVPAPEDVPPLRKLNVVNRTQAIGKALTLPILNI